MRTIIAVISTLGGLILLGIEFYTPLEETIFIRLAIGFILFCGGALFLALQAKIAEWKKNLSSDTGTI